MKKKIMTVFTAAALCGCGPAGPAGEGSVAFTTWGEEYIEKEIPAAAFEDGWSVSFWKFLVVIGDIKVAGGDSTLGSEMKGTKLFNHKKPGTKEVVTLRDLEAKAWTKVSYTIVPAAQTTELGAGATEDDLTLMQQGGYAVYIEGEATKGDEHKVFKWGFSVPTLYTDCRGDKDGKDTIGVIVTNGGTDSVELTIHGDHFFYDDLQSPDAKLRFTAIALADKDADGEVTLAELSDAKLVAIDPANGAYGTGVLSDINDLGAFVTELSRTVGHFRGEGECISTDVK